MEVYAGSTLSRKEYISLAEHYTVRIKAVSAGPMPPVHYGRVEGRSSREILAYLFFDAAREEWILFSPEDCPEECAGAFSDD